MESAAWCRICELQVRFPSCVTRLSCQSKFHFRSRELVDGYDMGYGGKGQQIAIHMRSLRVFRASNRCYVRCCSSSFHLSTPTRLIRATRVSNPLRANYLATWYERVLSAASISISLSLSFPRLSSLFALIHIYRIINLVSLCMHQRRDQHCSDVPP